MPYKTFKIMAEREQPVNAFAPSVVDFPTTTAARATHHQ